LDDDPYPYDFDPKVIVYSEPLREVGEEIKRMEPLLSLNSSQNHQQDSPSQLINEIKDPRESLEFNYNFDELDNILKDIQVPP
jgi:hypothetical protein